MDMYTHIKLISTVYVYTHKINQVLVCMSIKRIDNTAYLNIMANMYVILHLVPRVPCMKNVHGMKKTRSTVYDWVSSLTLAY